MHYTHERSWSQPPQKISKALALSVGLMIARHDPKNETVEVAIVPDCASKLSSFLLLRWATRCMNRRMVTSPLIKIYVWKCFFSNTSSWLPTTVNDLVLSKVGQFCWYVAYNLLDSVNTPRGIPGRRSSTGGPNTWKNETKMPFPFGIVFVKVTRHSGDASGYVL